MELFAGLDYQNSYTELRAWFSAAWHAASGRGGICATEMQLGSYQSA